MADEKEQEKVDQEFEEKELEQQTADALDWDEDVSKDPEGDEPWEGEEKSDEDESKANDEVAAKEEEEPEKATEKSEESIESEVDEDGVKTYTLNGKKYTPEEIIADEKLLDNLATHHNQVGNFQKLLDEEREAKSEQAKAIKQLEAEKAAIEREWVARKMTEETEARKKADKPEEAPAPVPRPANKVLQAQLKPYIDQLKEDGRLTDDEIDEHGGLIAEYVYDYANMSALVNKVAAAALQKIDEQAKRIEQIEHFVNPAIQSWSREQAERSDVDIQKEAAAIEGYDELKDPENWEKLKKHISDKIAASPKDSEGRPTFDPIFDAETMASQWDALNGPATRKALAELKKRAEEQKKDEAQKAGGSAASGGKKPTKRQKPKGPLTPAEEALDFGDGRYAG